MNIIQIGVNEGNDAVTGRIRTITEKCKIVFIDASQAALTKAYKFYKTVEFAQHDMSFVLCVVSALKMSNDNKQIRLTSFFYPLRNEAQEQASCNLAQLQGHGFDNLCSIFIPAMTIDEITNIFFNTEEIIDYLFIDAESLDTEIILSLENPSKFINITFEHRHTDGPFHCGDNYNAAIVKLAATHKIIDKGNYDVTLRKIIL